jgi:hypothetical protein
MIGEFASETATAIAAKRGKKPKRPFTAAEAAELRAIGEALKDSAIAADGGRPSVPIKLQISEHVSAFVFQAAIPFKQETFLAEMALSYLVSQQEAFTKDYLFDVLVHKHQMLKSAATLTYEEIASHTSIVSLWASLAQKEVDNLGHGSIDDVATFFSKKLGIELSTFESWTALREHSYRRNLVIHNQGRVNETYRRKTGSTQKSGRITTDMQYVSTAVTNLLGFIDFVHAAVCKKLRLNKT